MRYSIDPGKQGCFCVEWGAGYDDDISRLQIISATLTHEPLPVHGDTIVCERMRVRAGGRYSDDLIDVSLTAGRVCALGTPIWVCPEQWKGQVPKDVHQRTRILPRLSQHELAILAAACGRKKSLLHNFVDAAGIGLWYIDYRRRYDD